MEKLDRVRKINNIDFNQLVVVFDAAESFEIKSAAEILPVEKEKKQQSFQKVSVE